MIWAKAEKKRVFPRPRLAMMTLYTLVLCLLSLAAFAQDAAAREPVSVGYRITLKDVERMIGDELELQGAGRDIEASVVGRRNTEILQRDVPMAMKIVDLTLDEKQQRFHALVGFATEAGVDRPAKHIGRLNFSGRYDELVEVPVVKFRMNSGDIIRPQDVELQKMPLSRLDRNTIRDMEALVGKSPVRGLTAGRAVTQGEISHPPIVIRRMPVKMRYSTQNVTISAVGTAMQDGAMGQKIKVRNDDSGVIIDARVVDKGHVEVMAPVLLN